MFELMSKSAVLDKAVLEKGMALYNVKIGGIIPDVRSQAYYIKRMQMDVFQTKRNMKNGSRLPDWLQKLVSTIDKTSKDDKDDKDDNEDDGDELAIVPAEERPQPSRKRRRPLLRRVTSCTSTASTETQHYPPEMIDNGSELQTAPGPCYFDGEAGLAVCMLPSGEPVKSYEYNPGPGGFIVFKFMLDDRSWSFESEIPNSSEHLLDQPLKVLKKPAAVKTEPVAVTENKGSKTNIHSRAYHKKMTECKRAGMIIDTCKQQAREAARAAVACL